MATRALHETFTRTAAAWGGRTAVVEPGRGEIDYAGLAGLAGRVRDRLVALGVRRGDRVGLYLPKSIDGVAAMLGILQAGAAYVPVDTGAPAPRCAYILQHCDVRLVVAEAGLADRVRPELDALGARPGWLVVEAPGGGHGLAAALDRLDAASPAPAAPVQYPAGDEIAYILYTSGSTGRPKGVTLSHENAVSFVDWCSATFAPAADDRFSSHAPFHFDLSILDVHVPLHHGARLVLISEESGKDAMHLASLIASQRISCWYSAPSILALLAQVGRLEEHDARSLRLVLFAGEVFAVKHLRALTARWPHPRYFNLYGPTETNVCTFHEVPLPVPDERTAPYPIGTVCSHLRARVVDDAGRDVDAGAEGELCISGRGVMLGYWAQPELDARAFLVGDDGTRWYRTGDIVVESAGVGYTYRGRRDRMVKRRGYRVELGEIEAGLYRHAQVREAAVIALPDEEAGVRIRAFLAARGGARPSLIEMKRFCAANLPMYMIPDQFSWCDELPKTSTDKIDYQRLKALP